jgi:hypothetical protein
MYVYYIHTYLCVETHIKVSGNDIAVSNMGIGSISGTLKPRASTLEDGWKCHLQKKGGNVNVRGRCHVLPYGKNVTDLDQRVVPIYH